MLHRAWQGLLGALIASLVIAAGFTGVASAAPKVDFTCSPSCSATVGATITFTASSDASKPIYRWDLNGDGVYNDAFGATASETFKKAGKYTVSLQVTDSGTQLSSTVSHTIAISPAPPPSASFLVSTPGQLRPGELIHFTSNSTIPAGYRVWAYHWDFNNDGRWDADTGNYGTAAHRFSTSGNHTVRMEMQGSGPAGDFTSVGSINFNASGVEAGCSGVLRLGFLEFLSNCIKNDNGKYSITLDGGVSVAGVELSSDHAGAKLTLDTTGSNENHDNPDHKWALRSEGPVTISLLNTSIGTVTLGVVDLEHHPVLLPVGADTPDQNAPGLRLFTFEAQQHCNSRVSGVPPVVCAQLPGNFAIEGSISLYLTGGVHGEDPGAAAQLNLNLHRPISVSGHITMTGDATGLHVDSFTVQTDSFNIGSVVTVNPISLSYTRHDDDTNQDDVWSASGGAMLRVIPANPVGIRVGLRWSVASGSWEVSVNASGRVPIGPVILTQLGGTIGFNPFIIGANVAGSVGPLGVSAGFLYQSDPVHFQIGTSDPDHDPHHVAPLFISYPSSDLDVAVLKIGGQLDIYGDGFISGGINVVFRLPHVSSTDPNVDVEGYVRGFFAPPTASQPNAQYQISGGVRVAVKVLISLEGEVQGFVNHYWDDHGVEQNWATGCGHVGAQIGPFHPTIGGWVRVDLAHGDHVDDGVDFSGTGCDNISGYCAPDSVGAGHDRPPCLGFPAADVAVFQMSSAPQRFWIPAGTSTENLKLTSATGIPQVTVSGPSGTYTTSASPASTGHLPFISGGDESQHELIIAIDKPKPGAYTITPVAGSPAVSKVLESHPLGDPHLRVKITGHGRKRTLRYSLRSAPGQRVEFIERAKDVSKVIGTTTKSHGAITFVPQAALTRKRTIIAQFFESEIPQSPRTAASYTAPAPPKLGKPRSVRITRARNKVTITWGKAALASQYQVTVTGSDGRHDIFVLSARHRRSLVIKPVFPEVSLKVSVSALGGLRPQPGPARTARLRGHRRKAVG
jgi:PKD repeat protein